MAKFERYDARDDAFFDGGEIEDEDEEGSRLPLLLVIGLLVVAAFAGVVWLAYTQGVQRGRADAPRMLVAASGPVKEAPANPGGTQTPYTGLKIYEQPAPENEDIESAPQPPTPQAAAPAKSATPAPAKMKVAEKAATTPVATKPPHSLQAPAGANSVPALKPSTAVTAKSDLVAKPVAAPSTPKQSAMVIAPAPVAAAGNVALQIGAYKSEEEASAAWAAFSSRHPMAKSYQNEVQKADLGSKGVWYRLRLGSFVDKTEAVAFCDKLKADGGTCFLAR